jgi:hypothetical protein
VSNYSDDPPRRRDDDDYPPRDRRREEEEYDQRFDRDFRREPRDHRRDDEEYDRRFDRDFGGGRHESRAARSALNTASGGLFAVAGLQLICGSIVLVAAPQLRGMANEAILIIGVIVFGTAIVFAGLGVWARYQPLPPAIIGLVLYGLLAVADLFVSVQQGGEAQGYLGLVVKLIIIGVLVNGVSAANRYNRLTSRRWD